MSPQFFLMKAYFFRKITSFQKKIELFYSGLILGHFCSFLDFDKENELALKLNFTHWGRISVSNFGFFIGFSNQIRNQSEFLAKSEFVAQHYILTIFTYNSYYFARNNFFGFILLKYSSYLIP